MRILNLIFILILILFVSCFKNEVKLTKNTLYPIKVSGKYGLIDSTGNIIVNPQFDDIFIPNLDKNYDLIGVRLGAKLGFIDRKGKFKINPRFYYDTTKFIDWPEFSEGLSIIYENKLYGFIDTTGKIVIKIQYEDCKLFKEGLSSFKMNKKWGFIDKTGKVIIEPQFDEAYYFRNGIAEVRKYAAGETEDYPSLFGYVNKNGNVIWQPSN